MTDHANEGRRVGEDQDREDGGDDFGRRAGSSTRLHLAANRQLRLKRVVSNEVRFRKGNRMKSSRSCGDLQPSSQIQCARLLTLVNENENSPQLKFQDVGSRSV